MKLSSNKSFLKRFLDWAMPILVSKGAFYITLASISVDIVLMFIHKSKTVGEIGLTGDILFFSAVIIARWHVRESR